MTHTLRPSPTAILNPRNDAIFKAIFTQDTDESRLALRSFLSAMIGKQVSNVELQPNEPATEILNQLQMSFDVSVSACPDYAAETFLVDYAATGEAVFEILRRMGAPITPFIATALFTALSSDTGGFRFANTTAQTHRYAADLMELGADVEQVRIRLFESHSRGRVKLESDAMANMRYYRGGEIAVISISLAAFAETGIHESEIEGLAAEPLKIDGVHIGITLKERDNGSIRISMRSDSDRYNVAEICARFSGGGHVRAAGCRIWDTLENAEKQLISACEQALDR